MKTLTVISLILVLTSACSTDSTLPVQSSEQMTDTGPLLLKDGSYVFIDDDGTMRMTDRNGEQVMMKDGVEMELNNGELIMMKSKLLWRSVNPSRMHDHRKMK